MSLRFTSAGTILGFVLTLGACWHGGTKAPAPDPYMTAVTTAERRVDSGDYAGADRALADFALKAKGTPEAAEISFWRALYMIDPNNKTASLGDGVRALDIYLGTAGAKRYRGEALVLKRTAQTILALRTAQAPTRIAGRDTVFVTREDEIAALKEQLAKANAELERIKKRLANPER